MKKKTVLNSILIALVIGMVGLIVYSSYAFFVDADSVKNTFSLGKTKISLDEPNWVPEEAEDMIPGDSIYKDPTISGVEGKSYSRVILQITDNNGKLITDEKQITAIKKCIFYDPTYNSKSDPITKNFIKGSSYSQAEVEKLLDSSKVYQLYNPDDFEYDETRSTINTMVFNVKKIMNVGDKYTLFTNFVVPTDYTNKEMTYLDNFQLKIKAQGIQIEGIDTSSEGYDTLDSHGGKI